MITRNESLGNFYLDDVLDGAPLFLDIETTGLSARTSSLYLIGVVYKENSGWTCRQVFVDHMEDERDALEWIKGFAADFDCIVHFNGATFDIPYLNSCAKQYGIDLDLDDKPQIDLYRRLSRTAVLLGMERKKQKNFEERLGLNRTDMYSGGELIGIYKKYLRRPSDELLNTLLVHNRDDCAGMLTVAGALRFERLTCCGFHMNSLAFRDDTAVMDMSFAGVKLPCHASFCAQDFSGVFNTDGCEVTVKQKDGRVRLFFEDYASYYYLPKEDQAVYKTVGEFVDRKFREKASKETAYQWIPADRLSDDESAGRYMRALLKRYIF